MRSKSRNKEDVPASLTKWIQWKNMEAANQADKEYIPTYILNKIAKEKLDEIFDNRYKKPTFEENNGPPP